jgi:uncharacterized delta-60 repeat protein
LVLLAMPVASPPASYGGTSAIQPDGKIVLVGEAWPGFGAVVRVDSDGRYDRDFGKRGAVVDRRISPLHALTIQPDGGVVVATEGFQSARYRSDFRLARYRPDGAADPSFGLEGLTPIESELAPSWEGPIAPHAIVVRADGRIVVGGEHPLEPSSAPQAIVRLYGADGAFDETIGRVPQVNSEPTMTQSRLAGLLSEQDGSLVMAGSGYGYGYLDGEGNPRYHSTLLLARVIPGSGAAYDPSFGGGEGIVHPVLLPPSKELDDEEARAIAGDGGQFIVAGQARRTFLLARYNPDGTLDPSFGSGGLAAPPIEGTSGGLGSSWASAVAVQQDGRLLVAGGTSRWDKWGYSKGGPYCEKCPDMLIARFTPDGDLDPSFGSAGLVRLSSPSGVPLHGEVKEVVPLSDGKVLAVTTSPEAALLARLNADGSLDRSFGDQGLDVVNFPCWEKGLAKLRRQRCIATARLRLRVGGLSTDRPAVSFRVKPSLPWARIRMVRLQLPPALRTRDGFASRVRAVAIGGTKGAKSAEGTTRYLGTEPVEEKSSRLAFRQLGEPRALDVKLLAGALRKTGRFEPNGDLVFRLTIRFGYKGGLAGKQTVRLRVNPATVRGLRPGG